MNHWNRFVAATCYYPTLGFSRLMVLTGIWHAWDWIDEFVALGGRPTRRTLRQLANEGVRGVVNFCAEYRGDATTLAALGIEQLHLPTTDYCPLADEDVRRSIQFIRGWSSRGGRVFLHCKAGQGRSAAAALCYLMETDRLTATQGVARLRRVRPHVMRRIEQLDVVRRFEKELRAAGGAVSRGDAGIPPGYTDEFKGTRHRTATIGAGVHDGDTDR